VIALRAACHRARPDRLRRFRVPVARDEAGKCVGYLYISLLILMYTYGMDVAVTELRAHLGRWIDAARDGNDIVITDRGTPVARIVALDSTPVIDRLTAQGVISRPTHPTRPVAGDRRRPTPKRPVADIVSEQRR
jgi:prevent-host-death family protein